MILSKSSLRSRVQQCLADIWKFLTGNSLYLASHQTWSQLLYITKGQTWTHSQTVFLSDSKHQRVTDMERDTCSEIRGSLNVRECVSSGKKTFLPVCLELTNGHELLDVCGFDLVLSSAVSSSNSFSHLPRLTWCSSLHRHTTCSIFNFFLSSAAATFKLL